MNLVHDDESCQEWNYSLFQNLLLPADILTLPRLRDCKEVLESRPAVKISANFSTISKCCRAEISANNQEKRHLTTNS